MSKTLEQDAQACDDAIGTAIYYAKRMDDDQTVRELVRQ